MKPTFIESPINPIVGSIKTTPYGSYWHAEGSGLDAGYNERWNVGASGGHDLTLQLVEV